jgi:hypothetical protein
MTVKTLVAGQRAGEGGTDEVVVLDEEQGGGHGAGRSI